MEYKQTLNLPQTDFPIRANLAKVEAEMLKFWEEQAIYQKLQEKNKNQKKYILHDGPPYPNGDIHLGHALNKILKDIVVKYKSMKGFNSPFIPGWDCHGLPIETQLLKESKGQKPKIEDLKNLIEFREKCKEYALKYVDIQRQEFKRLGVFADWGNPYLTLDPDYEEKIIETFGILAEKGYVYRGLKPIHWCSNCVTALAEAEIEYEEEKSPSIYVKFEIKTPKSEILNKFKVQNPNFKNFLEKPWFMVIWTTTPWTLPANVAIAAHPDYEYIFLYVKEKEEVYIIAEGLLEDFVKRLEIKDYKIIDKTKGKFLEGILAQHPFIKREALVVLDELVTLEQGTGLVHIAPGHGEEDYQVGLNYKLPILMPVDDHGYFDQTAPDFLVGKHYEEANKLITEKMKSNGTLLKLEFISHSYPHCWRCKKPVIFRATEQWFISVDHQGLRQKALTAIGQTQWFPAWGENRIRGMVETRPDWCISRQRFWGVPIPAFYCKSCKKPQLTGVFNQAARALIKKEGSNGWFIQSVSEILPPDTVCPECGGKEFEKETNILDVWFESGSSHAAVLETHPDLSWPADLYLEGSDQHRGWFQSSLLTGVASKGQAPYRAVLTHGFTIDEKGKKMSKSLGNVVDPQDVVKRHGADVLRLWVASTDFRNDLAASEKILKQVQEAYTKIRNTCRFLISNLYDFTPSVPTEPNPLPLNKGEKERGLDLLEVDRWILLRLNRLIERALKAYEEFEPHFVYHSLYDFCVNDLSSFYLDISKDRLYCGGKNSIERRSAQFAMHEILVTLIKLMAPILSFTAEDLWSYYLRLNSQSQGRTSIFLQDFPKVNPEYLDERLEEKWKYILEVREAVNRKLEILRGEKKIGASLEAQVEIFARGKNFELLKSAEALLPMIFIVSKVILTEGEGEPIASLAPGKKCQRCWMWSESVGQSKDHPTLCKRCEQVISVV